MSFYPLTGTSPTFNDDFYIFHYTYGIEYKRGGRVEASRPGPQCRSSPPQPPRPPGSLGLWPACGLDAFSLGRLGTEACGSGPLSAPGRSARAAWVPRISLSLDCGAPRPPAPNQEVRRGPPRLPSAG